MLPKVPPEGPGPRHARPFRSRAFEHGLSPQIGVRRFSWHRRCGESCRGVESIRETEGRFRAAIGSCFAAVSDRYTHGEVADDESLTRDIVTAALGSRGSEAFGDRDGLLPGRGTSRGCARDVDRASTFAPTAHPGPMKHLPVAGAGRPGPRSGRPLPADVAPPDVRVLLLLDGHQLLADVLARSLEAEPDLVVGGRAGDTEDHDAAIIRTRADVVITADLDVARSVLWQRPTAAVVVLSAGDDGTEAVTAARLGVTAWLPSTSGAEDLLRVLRGSARRGSAH
jgi:hypothetical protein